RGARAVLGGIGGLRRHRRRVRAYHRAVVVCGGSCHRRWWRACVRFRIARWRGRGRGDRSDATVNDKAIVCACEDVTAAELEGASVIIVGGGIMGLALAWHLAGLGERDVLVLERGYLCEGASGRNGGGVRAQWTTPAHIELAKESIEFMGRFAQELGINVWLRRGGYLFLAADEQALRLLENGARLHRAHGLATRIIGAGEASDLVPE